MVGQLHGRREDPPRRDVEQSAAGGGSPADGGAPVPAGVGGPFRNRFGHWRAGWRFVLYLATVLLLGIGLAAVRSAVPGDGPTALTSWGALVRFAGRAVVLAVAAVALLRFLDHRPASMLGLGFERGWLRELVIGTVAGIGLVSAVVVVLVATGRVTLELAAEPADALLALPRVVLVFLLAGAAEELLFRGYPLQVLGEGTRPWLAATALCGLFALVHMDNPDATAVGGGNIFLIGLLLAVGYMQTRRLWLPVGLHMSFNLAQGWLWGFDVSGYRLEDTLLRAVPDGPDIVTGGGFGVEGSVVTTVVVGAVLVWALVVRALRPVPEVAATWARYPRGFGLAPAAPAADGSETQSGPGSAAGPSPDAGSTDSTN